MGAMQYFQHANTQFNKVNWTSGKGVDQLRFMQVFECCLANHNMCAIVAMRCGHTIVRTSVVSRKLQLATDTRPRNGTGGGLNTPSGL